MEFTVFYNIILLSGWKVFCLVYSVVREFFLAHIYFGIYTLPLPRFTGIWLLFVIGLIFCQTLKRGFVGECKALSRFDGKQLLNLNKQGFVQGGIYILFLPSLLVPNFYLGDTTTVYSSRKTVLLFFRKRFFKLVLGIKVLILDSNIEPSPSGTSPRWYWKGWPRLSTANH